MCFEKKWAVVSFNVSKCKGKSDVVEVVVNVHGWWNLVVKVVLCGLLHHDDAAIGKGGIVKFVVAFMFKFEVSGSAYGEGSDGFVILW